MMDRYGAVDHINKKPRIYYLTSVLVVKCPNLLAIIEARK